MQEPPVSTAPIDTTAGVSPAMSGLDTSYAEKDLPDASAGYENIQQQEQANLGEQFNQPPPQPQSNPLGRLFPLLAIAAFGGKSSKLDAGSMLAATTGVVKGYLSGNAEAYQSAEQKYQDAYERFKDRQSQQDKIFKEMREAYKGRIDADVKALQFARQLTHDDAVAEHQTAAMAQQYKEYTAKLDLESTKEDARIRHEEIMARIAQQNANSNSTRAGAAQENADTHRDNPPGSGAAAKKNAEAKQLVSTTIPMIDETIAMIKSKHGTTGIGGIGRSIKENVMGSIDHSSDQTAHRVNSNLTTLTAAATHMAGLRPGVQAMKEFANTLGSQGFGSNDAATIQNLEALKQRLTGAESEQVTDSVAGGGAITISGPDKPVGTVMQVPDMSGQMMKVKSLGGGKWEATQ